jgi:MFS family permease
MGGPDRLGIRQPDHHDRASPDGRDHAPGHACQMSFLRAIHAGSSVFVALFAGVLVDRYRQRPLLVGIDVGFAVVASSIPLLALADFLRMEYLYLVVLGSGSSSMVSTIAGQSFVPSLVSGRQLVEANSQLQASTSAASILGPGLGGFLIELLTAPLAIRVGDSIA